MAAICAAHAHLAHLAELDLEWSTVGVRGRGASDRTRHGRYRNAALVRVNVVTGGSERARDTVRSWTVQ
jgi:hypothetical protein